MTRVERQQTLTFKPGQASREPFWEPPVDVLELEDALLILVALPGVATEHVETVIDEGDLIVTGRRVLPPELQTAVIHRLELPHGRFERRIPLPAGRYSGATRTSVNGCLLISLQKL